MISFFVFKCKMRLKKLLVSFVKVESSFFLTQVSPKWIYFNNKAEMEFKEFERRFKSTSIS